VVIILKENHTFDNYFGTFPGANGARLPRSPNPPARDHPHTHAAWLARQTTAAREQFVEQDIPAYFSYARKFCLCDNYYTDVAGPSTPNHLMLLCADSPIIDNPSRRTPQTIKIVRGGLWPDVAVFLTWDDWGGWYDHVEPPAAEVWHANGAHPRYMGSQFRYGPRVGCIVLGPYARNGYISKVLHSHVSLLKFCEVNFGLATLNPRDARADDMSDCFDFGKRPAPPPPAVP